MGAHAQPSWLERFGGVDASTCLTAGLVSNHDGRRYGSEPGRGLLPGHQVVLEGKVSTARSVRRTTVAAGRSVVFVDKSVACSAYVAAGNRVMSRSGVAGVAADT